MSMGIYGRKVGMTQVFGPEGGRVPVTVVQAGPCTVIRIKAADGPDGYNSVLVGYGEVKAKKVNKPKAGLFQKAGVEPKAHLREARVAGEDLTDLEVGQQVGVTRFDVGQRVDVIGRSKGRGFTGVLKRHNFSAPKKTHGTHEKFRHGGSLGQCTTPGGVYKGKTMAGRHGNTRVTIQNLVVVGIDVEKNLLLIRGGLPGPNGRLVWIQDAVKH